MLDNILFNKTNLNLTASVQTLRRLLNFGLKGQNAYTLLMYFQSLLLISKQDKLNIHDEIICSELNWSRTKYYSIRALLRSEGLIEEERIRNDYGRYIACNTFLHFNYSEERFFNNIDKDENDSKINEIITYFNAYAKEYKSFKAQMSDTEKYQIAEDLAFYGLDKLKHIIDLYFNSKNPKVYGFRFHMSYGVFKCMIRTVLKDEKALKKEEKDFFDIDEKTNIQTVKFEEVEDEEIENEKDEVEIRDENIAFFSVPLRSNKRISEFERGELVGKINNTPICYSGKFKSFYMAEDVLTGIPYMIAIKKEKINLTKYANKPISIGYTDEVDKEFMENALIKFPNSSEELINQMIEEARFYVKKLRERYSC